MAVIIKQELKNYLKNPIYLVGSIIILIGIYRNLSPYLELRFFPDDKQIETIQIENLSEADIMDGYFKTTLSEQINNGLMAIKKTMIDGWEMSAEEAGAIIEDVRANNKTIPEMCSYLEKNYNYYYSNALITFEENGIRQGNATEVNNYISKKLSEHNYSWYFARKFVDFTGLFSIFFATVLLSFLFMRDMKKDTYELLHTKPISACKYVLGKIAGGFLAILLIICIICTFFTFLCMVHGKREGLPVFFFDLYIASLFYIVPNILIIVCVYAGISIIFKTPLPAVPLLFIYIVYSNMGSINTDGLYGFYGRTLGILARFPGMLLETSQTQFMAVNQIFLIIMSGILILISIAIWKRRKTY